MAMFHMTLRTLRLVIISTAAVLLPAPAHTQSAAQNLAQVMPAKQATVSRHLVRRRLAIGDLVRSLAYGNVIAEPRPPLVEPLAQNAPGDHRQFGPLLPRVDVALEPARAGDAIPRGVQITAAHRHKLVGLEELFGPDYVVYKSSVKRWIPGMF